MSGKIREITEAEFEREVKSAGCAVLDFYSTECPPCEALASKYEVLSGLYGDDVKFFKIFRQQNRELAAQLGVSGSPTVLFFKDGKLTGDKLSGGITRSALMKNLDALVGEKRAAEIKKNIKQKTTETEVLVLGGGPAGLTAAIYLGQAHVKTILVDPALSGGYMGTTHQVSNYPGFIDPVPGFMLAHYMSEQAKGAGAEFRLAAEINSVDLINKEVLIEGYEKIKAKKIIVATGTTPKAIGVPGEKEYRGDGISYCATCDAKYFEGREVVVIGGGNSAVEESLFISKYARVTIVYKYAALKANKEAVAKARGNDRISYMLHHEPRAIRKNGLMDMELDVEDLKTKELKTIKTNGIFIFAGFNPNLEMMPDSLQRGESGYIHTDKFMRTSIPDVYAVGDVACKPFRQITVAVAEGTVAAMDISKELSS